MYEKKANVNPVFDFELLYEKQKPNELMDANVGSNILVRIGNDEGKIKLSYSALDALSMIDVKEKDYGMFLPDHIVAIYSGEESRLWDKYYFSSYDSYNRQYMNGNISYQQQRMVYFNHYYWDLLASILAVDEIVEHQKFLKEKIGLFDIKGIHIEFDVEKVKKNKNEMAQRIVNLLNPNNNETVTVDLATYRNVLGVCGYEKDMLFHMAVLLLYKDFKIIKNFKLLCDSGIQVEELSEGEKKLLLIYGAINITAGENLYLFDEPDAHLHEGRKNEIFDLLCSDPKSQFIISSHSPTMTNMFSLENVILAQNNKGNSTFIKDEVSEIISKLTNNGWKYIEHTLFIEKDRPLVLTEGEGDIKYIKKAIDVLSKAESKYNQLKKVDFLHCGGATNAQYTIEELKSIMPPEKTVIIIFDRDDEGGLGLKNIIGKGKDKRDKKTYKKGNMFFLKLPLIDGYTFDTFVIEDYFPIEYKKQIAQEKLDLLGGDFNGFPKDLKQQIKDRLARDIAVYDETILGNFRVLLDKIIAIIDNTEIVEEL